MKKSTNGKLPGQPALLAKVRAKDIDRLEAAIASDAIGAVDRRKCSDLHEQMIKRTLKTLTPEQRAWLSGVLEAAKAPKYENLVSSGKAPIGNHVELMCGRLPLSPPGRGPIRWKATS